MRPSGETAAQDSRGGGLLGFRAAFGALWAGAPAAGRARWGAWDFRGMQRSGAKPEHVAWFADDSPGEIACSNRRMTADAQKRFPWTTAPPPHHRWAEFPKDTKARVIPHSAKHSLGASCARRTASRQCRRSTRWIAIPGSKNMNSTAPLTGSHLRTYETIFQHPVSHNLAWHDVHALFRLIGRVDDEANGNLKVTRHGQTLVLHPVRTKDVASVEELMALRHFLERSDLADPTVEQEGHWLLVIDHQAARIFRTELVRGVPVVILPHEPDDYFRHAPDSQDFSRGKEKPEPASFFTSVAKALAAPGKILVFGTGTGSSNEMNQFIAWVATHQPQLARRIVGSLVVDAHHLTEAQLLGKAREFYAAQPKVHA